MIHMKKMIYIYVLVPSVLFIGLLIMFTFNNDIIGYLPPSLLSIYPLYPCWPPSDGFDTGGIPSGGRDISFFNNFTTYHIGQSIDPGIKYTSEDFGIGTPNLYVYHGNMTIWHEQGHVLKSGPRCSIPVQYTVDQITTPPLINSSGRYVFHADFGTWQSYKGQSYNFDVINP